MLGSVSDAEDAAQDLFADLYAADSRNIKNPKAYLAKWTMNRCLNVLRSSRRKRELYVGEWLPEPFSESSGLPELEAEQNDSLSYAYQVMLEKLTPTERAVFLLREAFEYDYEEIADILGKSATNCRKIFSRAKAGMQDVSAAADTPLIRSPIVEKFVEAFQHYDVERLLELLAQDATMILDGGGRVNSAIHPILGRKRVIALLTSPKALIKPRSVWSHSLTLVNSETNIVFSEDGVARGVLCIELTPERDRIRNLYMVLNPDKLHGVQ
ncbi:sigma-70 family RNA polymerase sigma factor [Cohnella faecalis]|uniref:Sigma-70 family RNA polymerase sigma factor n=2 Tax=Cohnella faecalis TaxID=2315694 RepID=A0A398CTG3_9BACL|nr:sigma-70 family RNA polymerase sigma factor [Cohnella faecalis]